MDTRSRLLALAVFAVFAGALAWVGYSLQQAAHRTQQELTALEQRAGGLRAPEGSRDATPARAAEYVDQRTEAWRTQVERLSARVSELSALLDEKSAAYETLKVELDESNELLNELLAPDYTSASSAGTVQRSSPADQPETKLAEDMLAELNAQLREMRTTIGRLENDVAVGELQILDLQARKRSLESAAATALIRSRSAAAAPLAELLSDRRAEIRRWAADVLGEIGPDAASVADVLHESLADPDEEVRLAARRALRRIEQ